MSDFFELPRPKPNPHLSSLDMQSLDLQPPQHSNPQHDAPANQHEIIAFDDNSLDNNDSDEASGGKADVLPIHTKETTNEETQKQDKISNVDNEDDKETHHESVAHDSTRKTLAIIEENLEKLKKEDELLNRKSKEKMSKTPTVSRKIQNIIDFGESDLGEVGEWVEKTANINKADDDDAEGKDSDFEDVFDETKQKNLSETRPKDTKDSGSQEKQMNIEKFGIGKPTNKKTNGGYMVNNLKDKANSMLLAQGVATSSQNPEHKKINEGLKKPIVPIFEEEKKPLDVGKENKREEFDHFSHSDWEEISKRNLEKLNSSNIRIQSEEDVSPLPYHDMWQIVKTLDLSKEKKNIVNSCTDGLSLFERLFFSCSMIKLPSYLLMERDQIFAFAKVSFDDKNPFHFRMLHTIYRKLTNKNHCVRYGEHWEKIGFQGRDPATDLRGVGMLGLLQILAFIESNYNFIQYAYSYSLNENHHFPLAVGLLNMTEIVLQVLREGKLDKAILQQKSVINTVNSLYFAVFFKFFGVYRANKYTENEFGELKKTVMEIARKKPRKLIGEFIKEKDVFCKVNVGN